MNSVFDNLVPADLKPRGPLVWEDKKVRIALARDVEICIRVFTGEELRPREKYECALVSPLHKGQNQIIALAQSGTQ